MCQLLGMNCNNPTDILFSFQGFCARGGKTDCHQDGWGIAFFEGAGCRVFMDHNPSISSPVAELVRNFPIHSTHVIAHIRKASVGGISIENSHPFTRQLWNRYWVFAHNGDVPGVELEKDSFFKPVGQTDSETAFCAILEALRRKFPIERPSNQQLYGAVQEITRTIAARGAFNYLLSDGEAFFAHCSTNLFYLVRQAPFAAAHLVDEDISVDFKEITSPSDRVALIATVPLTDNEPWTQMKAGELLLFQDGMPVTMPAREAV